MQGFVLFGLQHAVTHWLIRSHEVELHWSVRRMESKVIHLVLMFYRRKRNTNYVHNLCKHQRIHQSKNWYKLHIPAKAISQTPTISSLCSKVQICWWNKIWFNKYASAFFLYTISHFHPQRFRDKIRNYFPVVEAFKHGWTSEEKKKPSHRAFASALW